MELQWYVHIKKVPTNGLGSSNEMVAAIVLADSVEAVVTAVVIVALVVSAGNCVIADSVTVAA